jgi:hypothetical protein
MGITFLQNELESIEVKLRNRMQALRSDSAESADAGKSRRMVDYHALQTRIVWTLMKSTISELESLFERPTHSRRQLSNNGLSIDTQVAHAKHKEDEIEILGELSKRWRIWRSRERTTSNRSSLRLESADEIHSDLVSCSIATNFAEMQPS